MKKDECVSKDTYLAQQVLITEFLQEIEQGISKALNCLKGKDLKKMKSMKSMDRVDLL
jgi:hypothetical protein